MRYHRPAHLKRHQEVHSDNPNKPKPRKSRAINPASNAVPVNVGMSTSGGGSGGGRKKKALASELDVEIDELAGDGDGQFVRAPVEESGGGPSVAGGLRARPRRAAAVAAVAANRSKRWDEDIDLGDEENDDEDDDEDDEDEEEDAGAHLQDEGGDDDDEEDEDDDDDFARSKKGQSGRRRATLNGQGRPPIISSSGGPTYTPTDMAAFSNARAAYIQAMHGNAAMDPEMQRRHGLVGHPAMLVPIHARHGGDEEMEDSSPGVAPAAEGNEEGDEDDE